MSAPQVDFDLNKFYKTLDEIQNSADTIYDNEKLATDMMQMISIAQHLQNKIREYETLKFPKEVTTYDLKMKFINYPEFKVLYEKSPGLFQCALEKKLDNGAVGNIINKIGSASSNPKKVGQELKQIVNNIKTDIETAIKRVEDDEKRKKQKQAQQKNEQDDDIIEIKTESIQKEENQDLEDNEYTKELKKQAEKEEDAILNIIQQHKLRKNKKI